MKIKKIYNLLLAGSFLALFGTACDDFLTQENPNEMTTDVFWDNLSDCDKGLTAVYNAFKNQNIFQMTDESNRADLTWPGVWPKYPQTTNEYYLHTYTNSSNSVGNKWAALYTGIFRANQVIEGLEGIKNNYTEPDDVKKWQLIMGQARFFRGLFHFYLNCSFNKGNIPIMNFVPKNEEDFFQSCSSSELVKDFFREDLEYAESILPIKGEGEGSEREDWQAKNGDLGRITSGAASAVLGISYLYENNYSVAAEYFKKIIDNSSYYLVDCADNFTTKNEMNAESILEIVYTHTYNSEYDVYSQTILSNILNMMTAPGPFGGWGPVIFPSYWLYRDYACEPVDKRDPRNIIYLNTDAHGEIYYRNELNYTQEVLQDGKVMRSYPVLNLKDTCFYLKKVEVDNSGNPVIANKEDLPEDTYTPLQINNNMRVKPQTTMRSDGPWNIYYDNEGRPYRYRNHSIRASYSIVMPTEEDLKYYNTGYPADVWGFSNCYAAFRKYSNWDIRTTEKESPKNMDSEINFRVIRLADIYLMYAECLIKGGTDEGGVSEAMRYINRIRRRGGTILIGSENQALAEYKGQYTYQDTPDTETDEVDYTFYHRKDDPKVISTASELMHHLMYKERPLELSIEGFAIRFIDLRRWGITKQRFQTLSESPFTTWGIPFVNLNTMKAAACWGWAFDYDPDDPKATTGTKYQYQLPAVNYNDDKAYYPIPSDEVVSNPEVIKVIDK